jgi:hypothetical protein
MADLADILARSQARAGPAPARRNIQSDPRLQRIRANQARVVAAQNRMGQMAAPIQAAIDRGPPSTTQQPYARTGRPRSLLEQGGDLLTGIPQGLAGLVAQSAVTTAAPFRAFYDYTQQGSLKGGGLVGGLRHYLPLPTAIGESVVATSGRVGPAIGGNLGPLVKAYSEASGEGRSLELLVEDIGNIGMLAGGASKAIGSTAKAGSMAPASARWFGQGAKPAGAAVAAVARPTAATAHKSTLSQIGAIVRPRQTVVRPGSGIAGLVERAGAPRTAAALTRVGQGVKTVGRLGESVDDIQFAMPFRLAAGVTGRASRPLRTRINRGMTNYVRTHPDSTFVERYTEKGRADWRQAKQVEQLVQREKTNESRRDLETLKIAKKYRLDNAQASAAAFDVDYRFRIVADSIDTLKERGVPDEVIPNLLDQEYQGLPTGVRVTPEDVAAYLDWKGGRLDTKIAEGMDAVEHMLRENSRRLTHQYLAGTDPHTGRPVLDPAQLEAEFLPDVLEAERVKLERGRESKLSAIVRETESSATVRRKAAARAAANRDIPSPADASAWFKAGREAAASRAEFETLHRTHQVRQSEVTAALDRWERAAADASTDAPTLRRLANELDRKVAQEQALVVEIAQLARRADAAQGLARDIDVNVREMLPDQPDLPDVDYSDLPTAAAIGRAIDEIRDQAVDQAINTLEDDYGVVVNKYVSDTKADGTPRKNPTTVYEPEGDVPQLSKNRIVRDENGVAVRVETESLWEDMGLDPNSKEAQRLIREGFIGRPPELEVVNGAVVPKQSRAATNVRPEDLQVDADGVVVGSSAGGRAARGERGVPLETFAEAGVLPADAFAAYRAAVRNYWASKSRASEAAVFEVATAIGQHPDVVRAALRSAEDYNTMMQADRVGALQEARDVFQGLDEGVREQFIGELDRLRREGADTDTVKEFITSTLDTFGVEGARALEPVWGRVEWGDLADFIRGEAIPHTLVEITAGARNLDDAATIARLEQKVNDVRRQLRSVHTDQRNLRRMMDRAEADAGRREGQARSALARAVDAEGEALDRVVEGAENVLAQEARPGRDPHRRTYIRDEDGNLILDPDTGKPLQRRSSVERAVLEEGALDDRVAQSNARLKRLNRSVDSYNHQIANLTDELGRSLQDRLINDTNAPAIRGMVRIIRTIAPRGLGKLRLTLSGNPKDVSGLMGGIARKRGFHDELAVNLAAEIKTAQDGFYPITAYEVFRRTADENGVRLTDVEIADLTAAWNVDQLIIEINEMVMAKNDGNTPFRVRDMIRNSVWVREGGAKMGFPDDMLSRVEARFDSYLKRRSNFFYDGASRWAAVMPGRWRAVAANARHHIRALLDEAEAIYRDDPVTADIMIAAAEEVPTTIQQLVDAGFDPDYLTGGKELDQAGRGGGTGIADLTLRARHKLTEGHRPVDLSAVVQLQINQATRFLQMQAAELVREQMGVPVHQVIGAELDAWRAAHPRDPQMPVTDMRKALEDAGWALPPGVSREGFTVDSPVIAKAVADELSRMQAEPHAAYRALDLMNRGFKIAVLPLSPRWLTGNLFGNVFMAMVHGRMTPFELAATVHKIAKIEGGWRALRAEGGMPGFVPDELASHGLTYNEHIFRYDDESQRGRRSNLGAKHGTLDPDVSVKRQRFRNAIAWSYNLNEFVDNLGRSAVYLKELERAPFKLKDRSLLNTQMVDADIETRATQAALRAMGDFTRMTQFERRWVRQAYPFYAWLRHQTVAAMRLPLVSPYRFAWLLHITNLMNDPDIAPEILQRLGARIPIGNDRYLNIGGINPFGDIRRLPLDPTDVNEFTRGLTPAIDMPLRALTGYDPSQLRPVSRPWDERATDFYGRTVSRAPFRRALSGDVVGALGEVAYQATGELPQTRGLRDILLAAGDSELGDFRYGSGQRGPEQYDRPVPLRNVLAGIGNLPRIETAEQMDLARLLRDAQRRNRNRR